MFSTADTIVAIATPPGRGGIGIVRLSGSEAHAVALRILDRTEPLLPRHATFSHVVDREDGHARIVDQVIATWFAAPHSYTGEDVVELSGHGSPVLLERVVRLAMAAGARLAEPGEFTFRAFLNERMDLAQAEAVVDLVDAVTPLQARAAMDQLEGTLTEAIGRLDAALFDLVARLEASLDFPEEGFHFVTRQDAAVELKRISESIAALIQEGRAGRVVREGRIVVIMGKPNVGKSSLFNALVGADRAIVTNIPGTTRDLLTERVDIRGIPVTLVDTAGLRDAADAIEAEGVRRARETKGVSALTVIVVDGSQPFDDTEASESSSSTGQRLTVVSKTDLPRVWPVERLGDRGRDAIEISMKSGAGLDQLRSAIVAALTSRDDWRDPPAISNLRHVDCLEEAYAALNRVRDELAAGATEELALAELAAARQALEEISGRRAPEELLRHVFSRFCIGK